MKGSFQFIVMGDSSKYPEVINNDILRTHLTNVKAVSERPQFIFFIGDMVFGGSDLREQLEAWKALVQEFYPISMYYPALGNHEENETIFSNAFSHLPNEQLEGYKRTVYYVDYESARFVVLNSNRVGSSRGYAINSYQRNWLEKILSESNKKYNFVMLHVPAYPTGHHIGESLDKNPEERNALWTILERYKVTAVFTGHEHNYSRRITGDFSGEPIYHITTGGAGSPLSTKAVNIEDVTVGPIALYHFTVVDVDDKEVSLRVYDKENILIDCCRLFPLDVNSLPDFSTDIIIPINALWKYVDDGLDQGTYWRELNFDDSLWKSGLAELGYGNRRDATIIGYGANGHKRYITTYFRKKFNIENASEYRSLTMRIQRDDGAVVYLNGVEIYRTNMPSGIVGYKTLASRDVSGAETSSFETLKINASHLRDGDNVIAVEVHQSRVSSSGISFNFHLLGHKK